MKETLDKIIAVEIGTSDRPMNPDEVKITKAIVVNRSEISDILVLSEPERTESDVIQPTGNQKFRSVEHGIEFSAPEGWLLQEPEGGDDQTPTIVAVGPKTRTINPQIYLFIIQNNQITFDDLISQKIQTLTESENITILAQPKELTINGNRAFETYTENHYSIQGKDVNVMFKEIEIYTTEKIYRFGYGNESLDFDSQLPKFEETIDSFKILSQEIPEEPVTENGGGFLIATATYGSEMALEVQQLRELRDNTLLQTESGTNFMNTFNDVYYSFSPVIADYERENPLFKEVVKIAITPMLSTLSILNYAEIDSEQEILSYGIGIILMNVGMYFVAPAIIIYEIRKQLIK